MSYLDFQDNFRSSGGTTSGAVWLVYLVLIAALLAIIFVPHMDTESGSTVVIKKVVGCSGRQYGDYDVFWTVELEDRPGTVKVSYGGNTLVPGNHYRLASRIDGNYNLYDDWGGSSSGGGLFTPVRAGETERQKLTPEKMPEHQPRPGDKLEEPWRP